MKFDLFSIADLFADLIVVGEHKPTFGQVEHLARDYELEVGGSAAIFAAQFARLGGRPALIGILGADLLGDFVEKRLQELQVDTHFIRRTAQHKTPLGLNLAIGDDRAMLTVLGAIHELTPSLVPARLDARHWHVAGYFLLEALQGWWPKFARQFKDRGGTVSLDPNWAPRGNWSDLDELLPYVDVFLPNDKEALALTGTTDVEVAGHALAERVPLVVIKRGAHGASAYTREAVQHVGVPADLAGPPVIDTTGAGDNFGAGFIRAWLNQRPLKECLELAARCGTSSTRAAGGIRGQYQPTERSK